MLYLDSADLDAIRPLAETGAFVGVTTNPTILKKANKGFHDIEELDKAFVGMGLTERFYQAVGGFEEDIIESAHRILDLGPGVCVKIPAVGDGLRAAYQLAGNPILLTAIYHPTQALIAETLDVDWIAPYVGRMDDLDGKGVENTALMAYHLEDTDVSILAASIRSVDVLNQLMAVGVHDFTISTALATELINQPSAVNAWNDFEQDHARTFKRHLPRKDW